ncbi:lipopolysaccharide biosynthesis protein [uncultured Duncaniella sp.]|uniref:lipopolysaccharide biosynthesis protein n=1 Tax=uncultured Duncaniella sp. TaxID=2768039 RepID=UPI0026EC7E61|nr:polysaccharide biosynthesis protein [uncultured Duncaniella sp.]
MSETDNRRIIKNALYLYGRMLLTVGVSLYTARVVLDTLGVQNYGIYNLVGGIVAILGFINGTMAGATQRFLNYEMGTGDQQKLNRTFSNALLIHIGIAGIVLLSGETIGLWFVNNKLTIAPERMLAANITYQLSLLTAIAGIVQIPYMASVMAHEKMGYYALIAIINVLLKLGVALAIMWISSWDTLVVYAILMLAAAMIVLSLYKIYCTRRFPECHFSRRTDRGILTSMLSFSGWDLYGNVSYTGRMQGTIVILNNFGGTVLNAAGNLALTVTGTITSFSGAVITAFRPQIIQQYAKHNHAMMLDLINKCARYAFLLMGFLVIPMFLEMDYLLNLWLREVPAYTAAFCKIALIAACGELLILSVSIGIHATGRIKWYSFITGTLYLLELPAMYYLLKWSGEPQIIYVTHCIFITMILLTDTIILHHFISDFNIAGFWWRGVIAPLLIVGGSGIMAALVRSSGESSLLHAFLTGLASTAILMSATFCFGIDNRSRKRIIAKISQILHLA